MSNQSDAIESFAGTLLNDRGGLDLAHELFWVRADCNKDAADAAASTTTNRSYWRNKTTSSMLVTAVEYIPDATLTASDTVYATLSLLNGTVGAFLSAASIATTVANGNWVADTPVTLTLSSTIANRTVAAGNILQFDIAKASTGTVVPAGSLIVRLKRI